MFLLPLMLERIIVRKIKGVHVLALGVNARIQGVGPGTIQQGTLMLQHQALHDAGSVVICYHFNGIKTINRAKLLYFFFFCKIR